MLRITPSTSAKGAKAYFDTELRRGDYYINGLEISAQWHGKAAKHLGLKNEVTREDFHFLANNTLPETGQKLTDRHKDRVGYDFTFSVPKSVSLLYAHTQDTAILDAFRTSVRETMDEVETNMEARVRKNKGSHDRITGNMVWTDFIHFDSRPIDGVADPHLHCHAYAFNFTFDNIESKWKAGQFGGLKRDAPYYEAVFDTRLANRLRKMGYTIERQGRWWEISGLNRETIEKFSRRTVEINKTAEKEGIAHIEDKANLGTRTRSPKNKDVTETQYRDSFARRLTPKEKAALDKMARKETRQGDKTTNTLQNTIYHALSHSFERKSVLSEKQLQTEALRYSIGHISPEEIRDAIQGRDDILRAMQENQCMVTTRAILREERAMINFARKGVGTCKPLVPAPKFNKSGLGQEQKDAAEALLTSTDRIMALRGGAGTGKSWLSKEVVEQIEATGKNVVMLAPSAGASRGVLRQEGFSKAETVARFLKDKSLQNDAKNGVIWIDEAGLMGAQSMNRIFQVAERIGARVVLSGDTRQHGAVERGDALHILETQGGVTPATLSVIRRQKTEQYRKTVADIQDGNFKGAFNKLRDAGAIIQETDSDKRYTRLAHDYSVAISQGKTVLAVAPTHREAAAATKAIRTQLKEADHLSDERNIVTAQSLNFTTAQRRDPANYNRGQVIQFTQNTRTYKRGARYMVLNTIEEGIEVLTIDGKPYTIPYSQADKFQVYESRALPVAKGDYIRITQNGFTLDKTRLNNGDIYRIADFTKEGEIILDNKKKSVLSKNFVHVTHGYVTTSHASQGKTVDQVFIAQSTESLPVTSAEQFYVSVSRGREKVHIYTDDAEKLREAVNRSSHRAAAVDLFNEGKKIVDQAQRLKQYEKLIRTRKKPHIQDNTPKSRPSPRYAI